MSESMAVALPDHRVAPPRLGTLFLHGLAWVLLGYALLGRGFAYFGMPPLYIGECMLILGGVALLYSGTLYHLLYLPPARLLFTLMLWCSICTIPYLPVYGVDALRDAVLWGYGIFAFIVMGLLLQQPNRLKWLLHQYRRFALLFIGLMWVLFLIKRLGLVTMPKLPGSPIPIGTGKGGDMMVHLAGVTAFVLAGMIRTNVVHYLLIGVTFLIGATITRAGMLSFVLAMSLFLLLKPAQAKIARLVYGLCLVVTLLAVFAPSTTIKRRSVSVEQLWYNAASIVSDVDSGNLDHTRNWRMDWWTEIVSYTFACPYFWTGKGFGINLADSDGFQVYRNGSLRSPHNGHLAVLARAGVPGFMLWLVLHAAWLWHMGRSWLASRRKGDQAWQGVFAFLITYWTAFMINASFDVFLEGPMGGIWFWVIVGVGMAAAQIYHHRPEVLHAGDVRQNIR